uniref:Uncharacterized protein n=1 Tax=viral metagenome TaxID=1070528 RepID=A0A6C0DA23_9ZZZZ
MTGAAMWCRWILNSLARYTFAAIYTTTVGDLATAAYLVGHPGGRCFVEIHSVYSSPVPQAWGL